MFILADSKKRLLAAFLVLLALVLAACGDSATPTSNPAPTSGSGANTTSTSATTAAGASTTGGVQLTMWTWKTIHVAALEAIAKNYQAKTGNTVKITAYNPDEAYRTKITTAAQSGGLPDILSYWTGSQWDLAGAGVLSDITANVDSQWQSQFIPGLYNKSSVLTQDLYDSCQKDPKCAYKNLKVGQAFSVPYMAGNADFVYANKTLLKQAGLDPNVAPKTADEWLTMMKTVKAKTGTPGVVTGVNNPDVLQFWLYNPLLFSSCGVDTYDAIYNGRDSFTNPCSTKVLNWINSIAQNDLWMPNVLQTDIDPADVAFSQSKAAFDIGGTYTLSGLLAQGMSADNILTFAIPPLAGAKYDQLKVNVTSLIEGGVTKNSKNQQAALDFLKFMTSSDQMSLFAKTAGDLPAAQISTDPAKVGPVMPGLVSFLSNDSPLVKSKAELLLDPSKVIKVGLQQFITKEETPDNLAKKVDDANKAAWAAKGGPKP